MSMERSAHVPTDLLADRMLGAAACAGTEALVACARRDGYELDAERIACPVRIVWGTRDAFLPWPAAASRHLGEWLPHADLVVLDEVGHCPQLDVPEVAADLVLGFTAPGVVG
jgi:pimeloyl-ACP methyl ester carboxylesterase